MTIVVHGKQFPTVPGFDEVAPGTKVQCWLDANTGLKYVTDKQPRTRDIRAIVSHTTPGDKYSIVPGVGPVDRTAKVLANYQVSTMRDVSWDFTVAHNGEVLVQNDPAHDFTWQAGQVNGYSMGFELAQGKVSGSLVLWECQIKAAVLMIDFYTFMMGIPRQIPWDKVKDKPDIRVFQRALTKGGNGGQDMCGIYGHRNVTSNKSQWDPGDWIFRALKDAGYETFDFTTNEDLDTWKKRQHDLGLTGIDVDGLPLSKTVHLLKEKHGKLGGMWVERPMDKTLTAWLEGK